MNKAKIYLVGAGPGDPELITVKGKECIKNADVIIYDFLAAPELLRFAKKEAEIIYVGKKGGSHTMPQEKINELIVKKALENKTVVRLKGGDPFIFGRGGEEVEEIIKARVDFEIVPGVTSAIAAPAYAGIPLSHRDFTSSIAFITGHESIKEKSNINWHSLANGIGTLVFLMGVKNLPNIINNLKKNGMPEETPAALVRRGTTHEQITVTGTLKNIVKKSKEANIKPPSIIIIGGVVNLHEDFKWFEKRPLFGKKILVTRARAQASNLVKKLSEKGAFCVQFPTIKIIPISDFTYIDNAIKKISSYDWIVFTSVNGVFYFFERLFELGLDARSLGNLKTAVIGPTTSAKLLEFGIKSDIIPESYIAESVIKAFSNENIKDKKVLVPRAKEARPILCEKLIEMGGYVDEVSIYETIKSDENSEYLLNLLEEKEIDIITFTSSSTVKNFKALLPEDKFSELMKGVIIASIGPITSDTAKSLGFSVDIEAKEYTISGLCEAVLEDVSRGSVKNCMKK
jgi:uroporphyrinogen III methyltransferase / synthase